MQGFVKDQGQSGMSLIAVLGGLAVSFMALMVVSDFFQQTAAKSKMISGESEQLASWSLLMYQTVSAKCKDLEAIDTTFTKSIAEDTVVKTVTFTSPLQQTVASAGTGAMLTASPTINKLPILQNNSFREYDVERLSIIQKSSVLGSMPGRVLADLKVDTRHRTSKVQGSFTVPMLLELQPDLKIADCTPFPTTKTVCDERGGNFLGEKNALSCVIN